MAERRSKAWERNANSATTAAEPASADTHTPAAAKSPTQGAIALGWEGPLTVQGALVAIDDYPRMENPFTRVEFLDRRYEISDGEFGLLLDFELGVREATRP